LGLFAFEIVIVSVFFVFFICIHQVFQEAGFSLEFVVELHLFGLFLKFLLLRFGSLLGLLGFQFLSLLCLLGSGKALLFSQLDGRLLLDNFVVFDHNRLDLEAKLEVLASGFIDRASI